MFLAIQCRIHKIHRQVCTQTERLALKDTIDTKRETPRELVTKVSECSETKFLFFVVVVKCQSEIFI